MKSMCLVVVLLAALSVNPSELMTVAAKVKPQTVNENATSNEGQKLSDELTPVQQDGEWGYADNDGKTVIKPQFSLAHRFSEGLALVWTGGIPLTDPVVKSFVK